MEDHPEVVAQATSSIFPTADPYLSMWRQQGSTILEGSSAEREHCAGPAGSAMAALMATYCGLARSYDQLDHIIDDGLAERRRAQEALTTEVERLTTTLAQVTLKQDQAVQQNLDAMQQIQDMRGMVTIVTTTMMESEEALRGVCVASMRVNEEIRRLRIREGDLEL